MKNLLLFVTLVLMTTTLVSAQKASDYYPMEVGNYWIMRCDTLFGEYNPTIFRQDVEGVDQIKGEEYFRIKHSVINGFDWASYFWFYVDSTGIFLKAQSDTSAVDSATVHDTSLLWMPNELFDVGFTWIWDLSLFGFTYTHSIESVSEIVQVSAGVFNNCIMIRTIMTDTLENTMGQDAYFAKGVGEVLLIDSRMGRFELIEYFLQTDVTNDATMKTPARFNLNQNYPNPFNPETTIHYELAKPSNITIRIYNTSGQEIKTLVDKVQNAGSHSMDWNGETNWGQMVTSGVYLLEIRSKDFHQVRKMTILR